MIDVSQLDRAATTSGDKVTLTTLDITVAQKDYTLQTATQSTFNAAELTANIEMITDGLELDQDIEISIVTRLGSIRKPALRLTIMPLGNHEINACFEANSPFYISVIEQATGQKATNRKGTNISGIYNADIIGQILTAVNTFQ